MNTKRFLAFLLASVMVVGSGITAFADDSTTTANKGTTLVEEGAAVEGTGSEEGLVDTHLYRVVLPVIPATSLDYKIDPQGLIKETAGKAYGTDITVGEGNLFFKNHSTLDNTTEGAITGLSGTTDEFTVVNKSTFPIKVTVSPQATAQTGSTATTLYATLATSATPAAKEVYLSYEDNAKKTTAVALTASYVGMEAILGDAKAAYKFDYKDNAYSYAFDSAGTYDFATLKFKFNGKVTVTDANIADWTVATAATNAANEVRYTDIEAPKIQVKYKFDEVAATTTADIAGPTAASSGGSQQASEPVTGTGMTKVTGQAYDYTATFTKGTAYEINFNGVTSAQWSSAADGTYADISTITVGTDKVTMAGTLWGGASAGNYRFVKVSDGTHTYIIRFTIATS